VRIATLSNAAVGHTQRWVEWFRGRGHEVGLWSLERGPDALGAHPLPSLPLPGALRYPFAAPALARALARFAPDVVLVMSSAMEVADFRLAAAGEWMSVSDTSGRAHVARELGARVEALRRIVGPDPAIAVTTGPYNDWRMCRAPCRVSDRTRMDALNAVWSTVVGERADVVALGYAAHLNAWRMAPTDPRRPDGVHLTPAAATASASQWLGPTLLEAAGRA